MNNRAMFRVYSGTADAEMKTPTCKLRAPCSSVKGTMEDRRFKGFRKEPEARSRFHRRKADVEAARADLEARVVPQEEEEKGESPEAEM